MERIQKPLLEVSDLSVSFRMYDSGLEQKQLPVISSLSLKVLPGEILAVAGSSGSGKSLQPFWASCRATPPCPAPYGLTENL